MNTITLKKKKGCIDSVWLLQFPTSSASLNTVESYCLLFIPSVIEFSRTLVDVMGECFANESTEVQTLGAAQFMLYITMRTDGELYIATKYWHRVQHVSIYS